MSMKTRKILTMAALLTLAVGLFSCKDEPKKAAENTTQQEGVTFRFTMPGGDAHVVDTRAVHDNPEWAIDQLWMYVFDEKGETLQQDPIDISKAPEFKFSGTDAKYTYKPKWEEKNEQCQFFFVANMKVDLKKNATQAQLLAKMHEKEMTSASTDILYDAATSGPTVTNEKRIPMTAYAMQNNSRVISIYGNATVDVMLKRTVARIDIVNRIPGFTITKLELLNAFKNEYVVEGSTNVIANNRLATPVTPFATLDANNTIGQRQGTEIKKAFYLYEGKNVGVPDNEITNIKITADYGTLKGRVFTIPFKSKDPATGLFTLVKDVQRNHLYKITLGDRIDPTKGLVEFKIEEENWTAIDFEETFSLIYVTGETLTDPSETGATLYVADNTAHNYTLQLDNDFANHTAYEKPEVAGNDWITDAAIAPGTGNKATLTFKVSANTTGAERTGSIKLKSTANAAFFTLTVKQPK